MPAPPPLHNKTPPLLRTLALTLLTILLTPIESLSPSFLTSLPDCKTGSAVLTVSSPTTTNGYDVTLTTVTFPTSFTAIPSVALGLSYLASTYTTTINLYQWLIDFSVYSTTTGTTVVQFNRTSGIVSQISINYLALLSTSRF